MQATEVTPEHLFLGAIAQAGDGVAEVLSTLRMDLEAIRTQAAALVTFPQVRQGDEPSVPLSSEVHACLDWAITFATQETRKDGS